MGRRTVATGRRWARLCGLVIGLGIVGLWAAGAASAHVTVSADGATSGGSDQIITFRAPTESDTASTTGLKVQLPTDTPIASVLVQPIAGWTSKETSVKLTKPIVTDDGDITEAVSEIDWSADAPANGIPPGQFQEFVIIAGQLPDASSLTFKAIQTYSDGTQVNWIETQAPGSTADLDHPAPVLTLAPAASGSGSATASSGSSTTPMASSNGASKGAATTGIVLGAIGAVLGAAALVLVLLRRRNPAAQT
jgi:uncharacterized protein YcnI